MSSSHFAKRTGKTAKGKRPRFWEVVRADGLERHAVQAGTNGAAYYLYKVAELVFTLGFRVVWATLRLDPDFAERRDTGCFKLTTPETWRSNAKNFKKPRASWTLDGMVTESLTYRDRKDGGGQYIVRTPTQTGMIFDPKVYKDMALTVPDLVPAAKVSVQYFQKHDVFDILIKRNPNLDSFKGIPLPIYGADVIGTLFRDRTQGINLKKLRHENLLGEIIRDARPLLGKYEGVSEPMVYFGMSGTVFATHIEDMNLASVAYLHEGAPKVWWVIPPSYKRQVEHLLRRIVQDQDQEKCRHALRHKNIIIPPKMLTSEGIPYTIIVQRPGQYVFLEPGAVHFGMNLGWNLSEALNFATDDWVQEGIEAFGRVHDRAPPVDDDAATICYCHKRRMHLERDALDHVVKFDCFPAADVCRLFQHRKRRTAHLQRLLRGLKDSLTEHNLPVPNESEVNDELILLGLSELYDPQPPVRYESSLEAVGEEIPAPSEEPVPVPKSVHGAADFRRFPGLVRGTLNGPFWTLWSQATCGTFSAYAAHFPGLNPFLVEYMYVLSDSSRRYGRTCSEQEDITPGPRESLEPGTSGDSTARWVSELQPRSLGEREGEHELSSSTSDRNSESLHELRTGVFNFLAPGPSHSSVTRPANTSGSAQGPLPCSSSANGSTGPSRFPSPAPSSPGPSVSVVGSTASRSRILYPCKYCDQRLTSQHLKHHLYSHERDFLCLSPGCGLGFKYHHDRNRHYKAQHPGEQPPSIDVFEPRDPTVLRAKRPRL